MEWLIISIDLNLCVCVWSRHIKTESIEDTFTDLYSRTLLFFTNLYRSGIGERFSFLRSQTVLQRFPCHGIIQSERIFRSNRSPINISNSKAFFKNKLDYASGKYFSELSLSFSFFFTSRMKKRVKNVDANMSSCFLIFLNEFNFFSKGVNW